MISSVFWVLLVVLKSPNKLFELLFIIIYFSHLFTFLLKKKPIYNTNIGCLKFFLKNKPKNIELNFIVHDILLSDFMLFGLLLLLLMLVVGCVFDLVAVGEMGPPEDFSMVGASKTCILLIIALHDSV